MRAACTVSELELASCGRSTTGSDTWDRWRKVRPIAAADNGITASGRRRARPALANCLNRIFCKRGIPEEVVNYTGGTYFNPTPRSCTVALQCACSGSLFDKALVGAEAVSIQHGPT